MSSSDFFRYASSLTLLLLTDHAIEHAVAKAVMDCCIKHKESAPVPASAPEPVNTAQLEATKHAGAKAVMDSCIKQRESGTAPGTAPGTTPGTAPGTAPATAPGTAPGTAPPATAPPTAVGGGIDGLGISQRKSLHKKILNHVKYLKRRKRASPL